MNKLNKGLRISCTVAGFITLVFGDISVPDNPSVTDIILTFMYFLFCGSLFLLPWIIKFPKDK